MSTAFPNDPIDALQAAALLAASRNSVYRWARQGKLRSWRLPGGALRFSRADVLGLPKCEPVPVDDRAVMLRRQLADEGLRRYGILR